jgi:predicted dehydrogenase
MGTPIGIGIIGYGNLARNCHLPRLKKMEQVRLVGAMDVLEEAARQAAEQYDIPMWTTNLDELLALPGLDAVLVAASTHNHAAPTIRAAQAGKHVFCEKPMASTLEQADAMIVACAEAGVKLGVGHCRRFDNEWLKIRELIQQGEIGRPVIWRVIAGAGGPRVQSWFKERGQGQGTFVDLAVHHLDFARYTFGDAEWVFASTQMWQPVSTAPDTGTVVIHFKSGDEMVLCWSMGMTPGTSADHLHDVIGPGPGAGGAVSFPEPRFYRVLIKEPYEVLVHAPSGETKGCSYERNDMYVDEWQDFCQAIIEDRPPRISGYEARQALAIGLAALESGDRRQVVTL